MANEPLNPGFEKGRGGPPRTAGAVVTPFARDLIQRVADGAKNLWDKVLGTARSPQLTEAGGVPGTPNPPSGPNGSETYSLQPPPPVGMRLLGHRRVEPWFGPGNPQHPVAPPETAGRAFDFPPLRNLNARVRTGERVSMEQLRTIADAFDLVRLAIETRKDQLGKLEWSILPRKRQRSELRAAATPACREVEAFMQKPDRRNDFNTWLRLIVEDLFVLDAPSVYVRRTRGGNVYALEVIDGAGVMPLLDETGRQPMAPAPAYQHILRGVPAVNYTADELFYMPRNPRPGKVYGMSPVEQILMTVNVALRREMSKMDYFTQGNIPDALCTVPDNWTTEQIQQFQNYWDMLNADASQRRKMKFVPGNMNVQFTRDHASMMDTFDEWLARVICYAFSLPALPFIRQTNRSVAETAYDTAIEEGLQPMMLWVKAFMDRLVQEAFGHRELEFVWDDVEKLDTAEQQRLDMELFTRGLLSGDQFLAKRGMPPIGLGNVIFGVGPNGMMFMDDLLEAKRLGLFKMQPPMPSPFAMPGDPGFIDGQVIGAEDPRQALAAPQPARGGGGIIAPGVSDVLAGVSPRLLAAVGLGPEGPAGRTIDITAAEEEASDPLRAAVAHPEILRVLRAGERAIGRRG
jgi:hypothetical protein